MYQIHQEYANNMPCQDNYETLYPIYQNNQNSDLVRIMTNS